MLDAPAFFDTFRDSLTRGGALENLRAGIIGKAAPMTGPFGPREVFYADYVASGRALRQIEETILEQVLPYYANSHTEASYCGAYVTVLRREARAQIARLCGADTRHSVIFTGPGATSGLNRLVHLFGLDRQNSAQTSPRGLFSRLFAPQTDAPRATVLIGPYEHHSNILPWRESGAEVVEIPEAACGGPDLDALDRALSAAKSRGGPIVGAFSAASNVTGILTDIVEVTRRLKAAGALSVWDYAGGGPYLPINMTPAPGVEIDAIAVSPHKFVGGPAASGILIVRNDAVCTQVPTFPGGGTVRYVSPSAHDYTLDISEREEAGTPNVIGDIRAALAFVAKDALGQEQITEINTRYARRMIDALNDCPNIEVLGKTDCERLPIFSFLVRDAEGNLLNPQLATRIMSDEFGIQMRGGCACAGPYGHTLLNVDAANSQRIRDQILHGDLSERPGFVRFNLSYLFTEAEVETLLSALRALPQRMHELGEHYAFDPSHGTYHPRNAA